MGSIILLKLKGIHSECLALLGNLESFNFRLCCVDRHVKYSLSFEIGVEASGWAHLKAADIYVEKNSYTGWFLCPIMPTAPLHFLQSRRSTIYKLIGIDFSGAVG